MTLSLDRAPLGTPLFLLADHPDCVTARRLAALGLRRGAQLRCVQRLASGGRVVSVGGGRVAVDAGVLEGLSVRVAA